MKIGSDLHIGLVSLISEQVPIAEKPEGRDMLLLGISNQNGWTRSPDNKQADIFHLIRYLTSYFEGEVEKIESWGLLRFIDNALHQVAGTSTEMKLQTLRQQCLACWEKEQSKLAQQSSSKEQHSSSKEQHSPSLSHSVSAAIPPQLHSFSHSSHENEFSQGEVYPHFYLTFTSLAQITLETIDFAEKPLLASFKASPLVKRRIALERLENATQPLAQMCEYLENASALPEKVAATRHILKNQIYRVLEQIQDVKNWLDINCEAYERILEKCAEMKSALRVFNALKGDDETHQ